MILDCASADIVYTDLITGVRGNYLKPSLVAAGLDPEHLPTSDPSRMDFGADKKRAWKDIWGAGQGIGAIDRVVPAAALIDRLAREYQAAKQRLAA
jgi:nitronate monooxygenase